MEAGRAKLPGGGEMWWCASLCWKNAQGNGECLRQMDDGSIDGVGSHYVEDTLTNTPLIADSNASYSRFRPMQCGRARRGP